MVKKTNYDLFDWIEGDINTRSDYRLREWCSLYTLSERNLKKYFHMKNTKKESLIRLSKVDSLNLHLASITLESAEINNPAKIIPFFSTILAVAVFVYSAYNEPFFIMSTIMLILAVVGFIAHLTIGFNDISRLKLYIDKAIELQDKMEK